MKNLLVILLTICGIHSVSSQDIGDITLALDAVKLAYVKNRDSLFIKYLKSSEEEILVDSGLKGNGNNRFLIWTHDSQKLIYEKDNNLHIYNLGKGTSKSINHVYKDSLSFFKFYLINQIGISNEDEMYFSASLNGDNSQLFHLFKLDIAQEKILRISTDSLDVSNISVSKNGQYIAYASYNIDEFWKSKITILRVVDNGFVAQTKLLDGTFFFGLDWSPDGNSILARNARGGAKMFNFDRNSKELTESKLSLKNGQKALRFFGNHHLITRTAETTTTTYGMLDLINEEFEKFISDSGISFIDVQFNKNGNGSLFFTKQNRIQPIVLLEFDVKSTKVTEVPEVSKFVPDNPLKEYSYTTHLYTNGGGRSSSSYIYHSKNQFNDSLKVHPLLIVCYGGYRDRFPKLNYFMNQQLFSLLDEGYLIAFLNTRGIGEERQQSDYGKLQLMDTELFVEDITEKFSINRDSVYVMGHSHGATMVYYYLTHSELFAGGIAINGAADWKKQAELKGMSGLPWGMGGNPEELPNLYHAYSPIEQLENLSKPMLLFAGKNDTQIHADINAEAFYTRASALDKEIKLHVFQDEGHLIEGIENRNILWEEINKFLLKRN